MKKLAIIGNSVSIRIRPRQEGAKVYGQILEESFIVKNYGLSRRLSTEYEPIQEDITQFNPDIIVINLGCVDAPNRDVPLWVSDILFERKLKWLHSPFRFIYNRFIRGKVRRTLVKWRGFTPWVSSNDFEHNMSNIVTHLKNLNPNNKIILVGINSGNERIEGELPQTLENYRKYNMILERVSKTLKVGFIDVRDLNSNESFPDGIHYSSSGHKLIANRILKQIQTIEKVG